MQKKYTMMVVLALCSVTVSAQEQNSGATSQDLAHVKVPLRSWGYLVSQERSGQDIQEFAEIWNYIKTSSQDFWDSGKACLNFVVSKFKQGKAEALQEAEAARQAAIKTTQEVAQKAKQAAAQVEDQVMKSQAEERGREFIGRWSAKIAGFFSSKSAVQNSSASAPVVSLQAPVSVQARVDGKNNSVAPLSAQAGDVSQSAPVQTLGDKPLVSNVKTEGQGAECSKGSAVKNLVVYVARTSVNGVAHFVKARVTDVKSAGMYVKEHPKTVVATLVVTAAVSYLAYQGYQMYKKRMVEQPAA